MAAHMHTDNVVDTNAETMPNASAYSSTHHSRTQIQPVIARHVNAELAAITMLIVATPLDPLHNNENDDAITSTAPTTMADITVPTTLPSAYDQYPNSSPGIQFDAA